jgi:hypothetical protein
MNTHRFSSFRAFARAFVLLVLGWLVLAGCAPTRVAEPGGYPPQRGFYSRGGPPEVAGNADVFRGGQVLSARAPVTLQPGDAVETLPGGTAVIRYPDGGEVHLDGNTRVHFSDLFLEFGRILVRIRGWFDVETESVVTGVEGTEYVLSVARDGSLRIVVYDGTVTCRSKRGYWLPVRLHRGEMLLSNFPNISPPLVRPAVPIELDDARGWTRATALIPFVKPPIGYCCDGGKVYPATRDRCRGGFFLDRQTAYDKCQPPVESGYCCDRGKVYQSTRDRCRGGFFLDRKTAYDKCQPPVESGYCCDRGKVYQSTRDRCRGGFFLDRQTAYDKCKPPVESGYCCDRGKVYQSTRDRCRGSFFLDRQTAYDKCQPPVESGYCCDSGKVYQATRGRCKGEYYRDRDEAQRNCKPRALRFIPIRPPAPSTPNLQ